MLALSRKVALPTILKRSLSITKAGKADKKEIISLMENVYFRYDPSCIMSGVAHKRVLSTIMTELISQTLDQGHSFVARESDFDRRIIGACLNAVRPLNSNEEYFRETISETYCEKETKLVDFWIFLYQQPANINKLFPDTEKCFEIKYLATHPESQRRGVARKLIERSRDEAEDIGHKVLILHSTSSFCSKTADKLGMKCIYKIEYSSYKTKDGRRPFPTPPFPHTTAKNYALALNLPLEP